jgi:OFA family oxalate/formate antiporter-like MFS transporter
LDESARVFTAAGILTLVLGTVHGFSVLLEPLESSFYLTRVQASGFYSLALICLTIAVLGSHYLLSRISVVLNSAIVCGTAAFGLVIASLANTAWEFGLGYGVLFGSANGFGYALSLQLAARAYPHRRGLAIGTVTALYAVGASFFAIITGAMLEPFGLSGVMGAMAVILSLALVVVMVLVRSTDTSTRNFRLEVKDSLRGSARLQIWLWLGYLGACTAGLAVLGHAAAMVRISGSSESESLNAVILIGFTTALGGVFAGFLNDSYGYKRLLILLPGLTACVLILIVLAGGKLVVPGLAIAGCLYGATITVVPAAISLLFGIGGSAVIYGRVMTAWGLAALCGPIIGGLGYDFTGSYTTTLLFSASVALIAVLSGQRVSSWRSA